MLAFACTSTSWRPWVAFTMSNGVSVVLLALPDAAYLNDGEVAPIPPAPGTKR